MEFSLKLPPNKYKQMGKLHVRCDHSILQVQPWNFRLRTQVTQVFLQSFGIFWVYSSRNSYSSFKAHNIRHHSSPPSPHHGLNGSLTSGSNSPVGRTNGFPCHHNLAALPSLLSIPKMALVVAPKNGLLNLFNSQYVPTPFRWCSLFVLSNKGSLKETSVELEKHLDKREGAFWYQYIWGCPKIMVRVYQYTPKWTIYNENPY